MNFVGRWSAFHEMAYLNTFVLFYRRRRGHALSMIGKWDCCFPVDTACVSCLLVVSRAVCIHTTTLRLWVVAEPPPSMLVVIIFARFIDIIARVENQYTSVRPRIILFPQQCLFSHEFRNMFGGRRSPIEGRFQICNAAAPSLPPRTRIRHGREYFLLFNFGGHHTYLSSRFIFIMKYRGCRSRVIYCFKMTRLLRIPWSGRRHEYRPSAAQRVLPLYALMADVIFMPPSSRHVTTGLSFLEGAMNRSFSMSP